MRGRLGLAIFACACIAARADMERPVLVSANLICAPTAAMTPCELLNQDVLEPGSFPPGYRLGLIETSAGARSYEADLATEFFGRINAQILAKDYDGTVLCGGSANFVRLLKGVIDPPDGAHANLLMCQVIYACPKHGGANVTGREAHASIDVHNAADATKRLTLKC